MRMGGNEDWRHLRIRLEVTRNAILILCSFKIVFLEALLLFFQLFRKTLNNFQQIGTDKCSTQPWNLFCNLCVYWFLHEKHWIILYLDGNWRILINIKSWLLVLSVKNRLKYQILLSASFVIFDFKLISFLEVLSSLRTKY
jgi:hypothetical protein